MQTAHPVPPPPAYGPAKRADAVVTAQYSYCAVVLHWCLCGGGLLDVPPHVSKSVDRCGSRSSVFATLTPEVPNPCECVYIVRTDTFHESCILCYHTHSKQSWRLQHVFELVNCLSQPSFGFSIKVSLFNNMYIVQISKISNITPTIRFCNINSITLTLSSTL